MIDSTLLRTGVPLTRVGLGAAQFGNLNQRTTDADSRAAVDTAWAAGIRYFDTAPHYGVGLSERRLGMALASYPRSDFAVSTKVGRLLIPTPERAASGVLDDHGFETEATHQREWDFSRDGVLASIEASLDRLGMDYVDIAYLHDPDDHWSEASTAGMRALMELRDQGVVRAIGAGMNQSAMLARFVRETDVDVVMVAGRYTLLDRSAEQDLLPAAVEHHVGVVAAGVYNSGLLSLPDVPDDAHYDYEQAPDELITHARRLAAIAKAHGINLPDAALRFPLRHPAISAIVVGTRTSAHVSSTMQRLEVAVPDEFWTSTLAPS